MNGQSQVIHFLKQRMKRLDVEDFEAPLFCAKPLPWLLELTTNIGAQHKVPIYSWIYNVVTRPIPPSTLVAFSLVLVTTHPIFVTTSNDNNYTSTPNYQLYESSIFILLYLDFLSNTSPYFNINFMSSLINWRFSNFYGHTKHEKKSS